MTTTEPKVAGLPLPSQLLRRDLRAMAPGLSLPEVRYLVGYYYQQQEYRKSAANQARAAHEAGESSEFINWLASLESSLEAQIRLTLDEWTSSHTVSRWAKLQRGIGPVLAAGLAAHIDVTRSTSVGKLWRFAGQDPTSEWFGAKNARELVRAALDAEGSPAAAVAWLARASHRHPTDLWIAQGYEPAPREKAIEIIAWTAGCHRSEVDDLFSERQLHIDNAISHACESLGLETQPIYEQLYDELELRRDPLIQALAKRPWNADLKVLCWKIGESFVHQSGKEDCFYGRLYREYKTAEITKNEAGQFADQAQAILAKRNLGDDTVAKAQYLKGRLPDNHVHSRAKRKAVKMFLSHYWQVAYETHHGKKAPNPWIIEHGGHIDFIAPPSWPLV